MAKKKCDVYGCLGIQSGATVLVDVDGEQKALMVCDEHQVFFTTTHPNEYALGLTTKGTVEIRLVPAIPVPEVVSTEYTL